METMEDVFGPVISSYSRAQAIEDGVLVDLMQHPMPEKPELDDVQKIVKEAGFKFPIAMTCAAFSEAVCPIDGELPPGQDFKGRLWDVLMCMKFAIRRSSIPTDRIKFSVKVSGKIVKLVSVCGPGDNGEPVITVMKENED